MLQGILLLQQSIVRYHRRCLVTLNGVDVCEPVRFVSVLHVCTTNFNAIRRGGAGDWPATCVVRKARRKELETEHVQYCSEYCLQSLPGTVVLHGKCALWLLYLANGAYRPHKSSLAWSTCRQ